nr:unnamed protein product [Callosobruchus analis]
MARTLNELSQYGVPKKTGSAVYVLVFLKINSLTACVNTSGDEIARKNMGIFGNLISAIKEQHKF